MSGEVVGEKYYVGLDIGTNSVGWAVSNPDYQILKFRGHRMWGSRLFKEGQTAEARRMSRTARRRLERRRNRLKLLEELFAEEMAKVDPAFFLRLKESKYHLSDKEVDAKYVLFADKDFTDKEFYKKYPTIYHLREALLGKPADDIRELFLAVHHIIKFRGNFLYEGEEFSFNTTMEESLQAVFSSAELGLEKKDYSDTILQQINMLLVDRNKTKSDRAKKFCALFPRDRKKQMQALGKLVLGLKAKVVDLFDTLELEELDNEIQTIDFSSGNFQEQRDKYAEGLGDYVTFVDKGKALYDNIILAAIKEDGKSFSESKIAVFEQHKEDLRKLKALLRPYKEKYDQVFQDQQDKKVNNYVQYSKRSKVKSGCSRSEFYTFLKKIIAPLPASSAKEEIEKKIELDLLLPLLRVRDNGVISYQVHLSELQQILNMAATRYEFLNVTDGRYTIKEKIIKLMTFRIPYYVGPLNHAHPAGTNNGFSWVVRKKAGKVCPWTFEDMVDTKKSAEAFIANLTNKCTYLIGEDVLPKNSLLYSEFMLLNELNNLRYDGQPLPAEIKQQLITEVFQKEHRKMTEGRIKEYLIANGLGKGKAEITGLDGEIKGDLKSWRDMNRIFGDGFDREKAEKVIRWITLFGDAKKILKSRLEESFSQELAADQIKQLMKLHYKDWGRLSDAFLRKIKGTVDDGAERNIIDCMRETSYNLMQILSSRFTYLDGVNAFNDALEEPVEEISYKLVDDLYLSPAVKRSVWQSICILEEIRKIKGSLPDKIFVEVARTNKAKKGKQDSRQERLFNLYKSIAEDGRNWKEEIKNTEAGKFKSKKLYLYYTQKGRCMYSGEPINISDLFTDSYDIDHIYPRSQTKDDSFNNLVLVKATLNRDKSDVYPLPRNTQQTMKSFWNELKGSKLISEIKYERLIRENVLSAEELADFISRQLVETNQAVKAVTTLLRRIYPDVALCYVKAENVSDFRHDNNLLKVRELNDHHHAKDAYLNIVVGNVYHEKFTKSPANFIKGRETKRDYNLAKMFERDIVVDKRLIWSASNSMDMVRKMMENNDVRVTRKGVEQKGTLYNATICKARDAQQGSYFPLKGGDKRLKDVTKYGGYTNIRIAFYCIFKYYYDNKKEPKIGLLGIPIYLKGVLYSDVDYIAYAKSIAKNQDRLVQVELVYKKLLINSLVKINGYFYYIGGKSDNTVYIDSAVQILLDYKDKIYLRKLLKYEENIKNKGAAWDENITKEENDAFYELLIMKMKEPIFMKRSNNKIGAFEKNNVRKAFSNLSIEKQVPALLGILSYLINKNDKFKLTDLGIKMSRSRQNMTLTGLNEFKIITESVTGLYRKVVPIIGRE